MIKALNLYAGLGGNRRNWAGVNVTAVEMDEKIAKVYKDQHPNDNLIIGDAHAYLLANYNHFDFIWSSPPCQSHSRFIRSGRNRTPRYPDMKLYEEIIFLTHNFKGKWVVENVVPYYKPLIEATKLGRHLFWSNFSITPFHVPQPKGFISKDDPQAIQNLKDWLGIQYNGNIYYGKNHTPAQVLRNCVHPDMGLHVFNCSLTS